MEQFLWGIVSVFHVSSMYNFHVGNIFLLRGRPDSNYHWNEIYYLWNRKPWTWLPKNNSVNLYLANVPILYPLTFMPKLFWVFFFRIYKMRTLTKKGWRKLSLRKFKLRTKMLLFNCVEGFFEFTSTTKLNFCNKVALDV